MKKDIKSFRTMSRKYDFYLEVLGEKEHYVLREWINDKDSVIMDLRDKEADKIMDDSQNLISILTNYDAGVCFLLKTMDKDPDVEVVEE